MRNARLPVTIVKYGGKWVSFKIKLIVNCLKMFSNTKLKSGIYKSEIAYDIGSRYRPVDWFLPW